MKGHIRLVEDGGETQGEWEKHRLVELGLSKQLVDKMSTDDAKLALKDILGIVGGQATESISSSPSSSIKLYPRKVASLAQKALGQIETKVRKIDYSVASTIPARLASKGFNIATASTAKKYKPSLKKHSLQILFDHADKMRGEHSLSGHYVDKARGAPVASLNERKKEPDKRSSENILAAGMSDIKSWEEKGDILFKLGLFGESAACYSRFLEIHPSSVEAWNKKGSCLFNMARYLEAATCFDNALVIDNASASAWYGKACTAIKTFQTDSALHCLEKTVDYGGERYRKVISRSHAFSILKNDTRFSRLADPQNSTSLKSD